MRDADTSLGGFKKWFPATTEGFVDNLKGQETREQRLGADLLCQRYWKPVYHYLRTALARTNEDAKDLTQSFFSWLLERDLLARYDPTRGSFRGYLKGLLRNFLGNREQEVRSLKRGGGVKVIPIDAEASGIDELPADPSADPEKVFDQIWMNEMVSRAVGRVRGRCPSGLRLQQFRAFERHDLVADPPSYADLAKELDVKESDIRNYLFAIRDQVRLEVWAELSETASDVRQVQEEWNAFFQP